jgi:diguanylate cyclase (GGDEF)-like protein
MLIAALTQILVFGLVLLWPSLTLFLVAAAANIDNRRSRLDHLTGTANRRSLDEELENRIASLRPGWNLCGLLMDVDDFKPINDKFGHDAGDRALEDVGSLLMSSVRVEDLVARMGGDEFVVLLDSADVGALEEMVRRVETAIEKHNAGANRPYRLSLSIGRALFDPETDKTAADFLSRLDADMYRRKRQRKEERG